MRDPYEISCELVAETDAAVLVDDGDTREWLPKSQIEIERRPPTHPNTDRETLFITAPHWLLIEKGLV